MPSIRAIAIRAGAEADERLAWQVGRIALSRKDSLPGNGGGGDGLEGDRRVHAQLLKDMLVTINSEYRRRFGTPPSAKRETKNGVLLRREERDVEMIAV